MTDIRQCWAFHTDGTRCDLPAGHPNDHATERTWTDDECAQPGLATPVTENARPVPVVPDPVPAAIKCVGCGHAHKGGPCKCQCYEFIG
jgi:hypothetical protein